MALLKPNLEILASSVARIVAPPPLLTVSQWSDSERRLSAESAAEPGRWITDRAPYQRGIMDAIHEPDLTAVVVKASAQVGKSEILLNIMGYFIHHDPSPMLALQPTLELAESFSKERLAPMIRDTPALTERVSDAKARNSGNTLLNKKFPGGHIALAGANSPASLASRPVRVVLCDEVDRYPHSAGAEGDPIKLAQKRATTFYNRLYFECSTPTDDATSRIERSFQESDQRYFHVPCPLCQGYQKLEWPQIKFERDDRGEPINVRYACVHCSQDFDDSKKSWMLINGKWVAEAPFRGVAGFHIWEAYSPWRRWKEIVKDHLEAVKNVNTLKVWVNTCLGETWKEKGEAPEWKRLYERREAYALNSVAPNVMFITAGADVQKDRIEVEIVGWGQDRQSWSIDYRVLSGDTATEAPWLKLDELLMQTWQHPGGTELPIRMLAVDSGFNTQHVYNWARRHPIGRVMAIKGQDSSTVMVGQPSAVDVAPNGKRLRRGCRVWPIGVSMIKSELYSWLRLETPSEGENTPAGFCHFPQYGEEFFKQLTAEQLIVKTVRGYKRHEWQKTRERNEALDTRVYARAAASAIGMDRFTPAQWERIGNEVGVLVRSKPMPATHRAAAPKGASAPSMAPNSSKPRNGANVKKAFFF